MLKKKKNKENTSSLPPAEGTGKKDRPRKKNKTFLSLRKFIRRLFFFLFLALAAFLFYRGWIQLPEGRYALIYTKNGGYDATLTPPGQFVWRWENLIPENLSIRLVDFPLKTLETTLTGELPSGNIYGDFINQDEAFSIEAKVKYSYRLIPEKAPLAKNTASENPFENLYEAYEGRVRREILAYLQKNGTLALEKPAEAEQKLMEKIQKGDGIFKIENLELKKLILPDPELYREAKSLYLEHMEEMIRVKTEKKKEDVLLLSNTEVKMEILREYGKVLSEYPVLLDYFELDKNKLDPRILTEIKQ